MYLLYIFCIFYQVIFNHFYHTNAPNDQCTLFCDRNVINRRNISKDVSKNVSATKKFVLIEIDARIVAACMNELGISNIDGQPSSHVIPENLKTASRDEKRKFLMSLAERVVDHYILGSEKVSSLLQKVHMAEDEEEKKSKDLNARFQCRFPGCDKTYKYDGKRKRQHEATHGLPPVPVLKYANTHKKIVKRDDMYNYQSSFLEVGLLAKNFFDAISEGDGARVVRCWKFMLQYLRHDGAGSRKYALEAKSQRQRTSESTCSTQVGVESIF